MGIHAKERQTGLGFHFPDERALTVLRKALGALSFAADEFGFDLQIRRMTSAACNAVYCLDGNNRGRAIVAFCRANENADWKLLDVWFEGLSHRQEAYISEGRWLVTGGIEFSKEARARLLEDYAQCA